MSSNRFGSKLVPLRYDPPAGFNLNFGSGEVDTVELRERLETIRSELLADIEQRHSGPLSPHKSPAPHSCWFDQPERLLAEYEATRRKSQLGRILASAKRLREAIDRVVVLGGAGATLCAQALFGACCHPYHNELGRGDRGGRPRFYFDGSSFDNDATRGLLDLLHSGRAARTVDERWGMIVIADVRAAEETLAAFYNYLGPLSRSCDNDLAAAARLVLPVIGSAGRLLEPIDALGCPDIFTDPDEAGGRFSVFTSAALLPAAVMGLDLFQLLRGAAAMNERFRTAPLGDNPVLDSAAVSCFCEALHDTTNRILVTWCNGLGATNAWYDQFILGGLENSDSGVMPPGPGGSLVTNLIVDEPRRDRLAMPFPASNEFGQETTVGVTLPEMLAATIASVRQASTDDGCPTADIHLPQLNESALGQFFQMTMLATAVEERLRNA